MSLSTVGKWLLLQQAVISQKMQSPDHMLSYMVGEAFASMFVDASVPVEYLEFALELEGGIGDNTGGIRGPYQFSRIAWSEAGEGDWENNSIDLTYSARAALRYYLLNKKRFNRIYPKREYTNAIAYLYHNQGPSGAAHFLATGNLRFPKQSNAALNVFNSIRV